MKCVTLGYTHKTSTGCGFVLYGKIKNDVELTEVFCDRIWQNSCGEHELDSKIRLTLS